MPLSRYVYHSESRNACCTNAEMLSVGCRIATVISTYNPPSANTTNTPIFWFLGSLRRLINGIGNIHTHQSMTMLMPAKLNHSVSADKQCPLTSGFQNFFTGTQMKMPAKIPYIDDAKSMTKVVQHIRSIHLLLKIRRYCTMMDALVRFVTAAYRTLSTSTSYDERSAQ